MKSIEINFKKILINGIISVILYILLPIIIFYFINETNFLKIDDSFILPVLIFGIIGSAIKTSKYIFSEQSKFYHIISIGIAIFSGFYLFFIFGGFNIDQPFGNYQINTNEFKVLLGLQIIAWILLISSLFSISSSILKLVEILKNKMYQIKIRKKLKLARIFSGLGIIAYLFIGIFFFTLIFNGSQISILLRENYAINYNDKGTIPLDDDTIKISTFFDISNLGFYDISNVNIDIEIYTLNTSDSFQISLPDNTKIGEAKNIHYPLFKGNSISKNQNITIEIFNEYVVGLTTFDAYLLINFTFDAYYASIFIEFISSIITFWDSGIL